MAASEADGVIFRLEPGDVIDLELVLDGDLASGSGRIPVVVHQALLVSVGPNGPIASLDDGASWAPLPDLVSGGLDIGGSISRERSADSAHVHLTARRRRPATVESPG